MWHNVFFQNEFLCDISRVLCLVLIIKYYIIFGFKKKVLHFYGSDIKFFIFLDIPGSKYSDGYKSNRIG